MSMLMMNGQLLNMFVSPKGVNKNGDEYGGQDKVQILGDVPLPNGEIRKEMFTLSTHDASTFREYQGKDISVPVGAIANGKAITFFIPKGAQPLPFNPTNQI